MSELPENWETAMLSDVADVILGQSPPSSTYNTEENGLPFFQGRTEFGDLFPTARKYCSAPNKIAEADDILISVRAPVGPTNLATEKSCIGRGLAAIRPHGDSPSRYFLYYLRSIENELAGKGTGTTFQAISGKILRETEIAIAPLPEQRRIVARIEELFSRLDAGVAALRHAKAQLQRYRQSVLAAAVTGQLTQAWREQHPDTEPAEELLERILDQRQKQWSGRGKYRSALEPESPADLPSIPENWTWTTIDALTTSKVGNAFKSAEFSASGVRLLRGENIEPGALRWVKTRFWPESRVEEFKDLLIEAGDVIVAMDRPLISSGLKVAVAKESDTPCLLVQRVTRLRPIEPITATFLFTNVNTKRFIDQLIGNQTGTQLPHITEKGIRSFAVALPPLAEQYQIVSEVESRTTAIDHLETELDRQITRSNRLRQATLSEAFCGKL